MNNNTANSTRTIDRCLGIGAMLLTAVLLVVLVQAPTPSVEAGMVVSADSFTMMTAAVRGGTQTPSDEDALYIMDNHNGILLVYRVQKQAGTDRIVLVDGGFVTDLFSTAGK